MKLRMMGIIVINAAKPLMSGFDATIETTAEVEL
jgi:hypothetical protein